MSESPFRRIALTLVAYVAVGWVVWGVAGWFRRALALPELFETLLSVGLLVGLPLAGLLAWRYPDLGPSSGGDGAGHRKPGQ